MTRLEPQREATPAPVPSLTSAPFWAGCAERVLRFQRCLACGSAVFEPNAGCPACGASDLVWQRSAGLGTLRSWTVVWRPPTAAFQVPYAPVVVELDEGFHLLSAAVDCEPHELGVGLRVEVVFHPTPMGAWLPYVRPTKRCAP